MSSQARQLARGSALRIFNLFMTVVVSLFLMPYVVKSLGDRLYGFWTLVGTFLGYYGLLDLGLSGAISRHIAAGVGAKNREECDRVFNTGFRLYLGLGLVVLAGSIILALLAPYICRNPADASLFWRLILIMGLDMAVNFPSKTYVGLLSAALRFDAIAGAELLTIGVRTTLIVWVLRTGHSVVGLAWVTFLAGLPAVFLYYYFSKKSLPEVCLHWGGLRRETTKSLFSYSLFSMLVKMGDRLRFRADAFLVSAFVGLTAVTHYQVATLFSEYFVNLMIAAVGVFQPVFSQLDGAGDHGGIEKTYLFATKISTCLATFVGFGLIAFGKPFIWRWMGPTYVDAYAPLVVLAIAATLAMWQSPTANLLYGTSKHQFYAIANGVEGLLNLGVSLILVRRFGIMGVAYGTLVAMVIVWLFIQPWWACRVAGISLPRYLRQLTRTVAKTISIAGLAYLSCRWGLKPNYYTLLPAGLVAAIVYSIACWILVFNAEDKQWFRAILHGRSGSTRILQVGVPVVPVISGNAPDPDPRFN